MRAARIRHVAALSASATLLLTTLASPAMAGDKIAICHKPDTKAEKTLMVAPPAVKSHLQHGDSRGPCDPKDSLTEPAKDLVVAYSDLDADHAFGPADVLIAKVVDSNSSGVPDPGDRIVMGRYPTDLNATEFADWGIDSHAVDAAYPSPDTLMVLTAGGDSHIWQIEAGRGRESYIEGSTSGAISDLVDWFGMNEDKLLAELGSPSQPGIAVDTLAERTGDDRFIDIDFHY
jgi:hypothetical protein